MAPDPRERLLQKRAAMPNGYRVFSGSANPRLASDVARTLGIELAGCEIDRFPDGEVSVRLLESVRGYHVYVIQPTCPPVNDNLVELLTFADACRRAAASSVTAVVPYFGYSRADKRHGRREPITASMVGRLIESVGIDHLLTLDLHTIQTEGFFAIPVDTLTALPTLCAALADELPPDTVVVSPDAGRVVLATAYAERLHLPLAVLHKRRASGTSTETTHLVGEVEGKTCLIIDDMISTGGTLVESARTLREAGARSCRVAATHGLLLSGAAERLQNAGIEHVLVTDTVPVTGGGVVRVASVAGLLASAVQRLTQHLSLRELY
jgi:ribose-phosphate pyrophosphokinase